MLVPYSTTMYKSTCTPSSRELTTTPRRRRRGGQQDLAMLSAALGAPPPAVAFHGGVADQVGKHVVGNVEVAGYRRTHGTNPFELCIVEKRYSANEHLRRRLPPDDSRSYSTNELASPGRAQEGGGRPVLKQWLLGGTAHGLFQSLRNLRAAVPPPSRRQLWCQTGARRGRFDLLEKKAGAALARRAPPFRPSCRRCTRWRDEHWPFASRMVIFWMLGRNMRLLTR